MNVQRDTTVIVMPCLNEADYVIGAVRSLLDGAPTQLKEALLVIVDNGSTDSTRETCESLPSHLLSRIVIVDEPERGHVPARHCGAVVAADWAARKGIPLSDVVVVQADADTHYTPGYAAVTSDAVRTSVTPGCVAEARTDWPSGFAAAYPRVFGGVTMVDAPIEARHGMSSREVLVDDKACAYNLADYFAWGGHRREYFDGGEEILGETTRLLIAAQASGARRVEVGSATARATHSQRRMLSDAAQLLATAGFPYATRRVFPDDGPIPLAEVESSLERGDMGLFDRICDMRKRHLLALTAILPAHVARAVSGRLSVDPFVADALNDLPCRTEHDAALRPGLFVADVISLVWSSWDALSP